MLKRLFCCFTGHTYEASFARGRMFLCCARCGRRPKGWNVFAAPP